VYKILDLRQAARREDVLHHLFVHAGGAAGDAGPGVGQAGHLEQTLDGTVFGEGAVHDGEGEVDGQERPVRELEPGPDGVDDEVDRLRGGGVQAVAQRRLEIGGLQPAPVPGDAHGDDVVLVAVEHRRDEARGGEGDLVFGGTAAEDQGQLQHGGKPSGGSKGAQAGRRRRPNGRRHCGDALRGADSGAHQAVEKRVHDLHLVKGVGEGRHLVEHERVDEDVTDGAAQAVQADHRVEDREAK
jgi:hypothetical protein